MLALLGDLVFSDMERLTPTTLLELFLLIVLMEFIGVLINYTNGV